MDQEQVYHLLYIAEHSLKFPELAPLHQRAMEALKKHASDYKQPEPVRAAPKPAPTQDAPVAFRR